MSSACRLATSTPLPPPPSLSSILVRRIVAAPMNGLKHAQSRFTAELLIALAVPCVSFLSLCFAMAQGHARGMNQLVSMLFGLSTLFPTLVPNPLFYLLIHIFRTWPGLIVLSTIMYEFEETDDDKVSVVGIPIWAFVLCIVYIFGLWVFSAFERFANAPGDIPLSALLVCIAYFLALGLSSGLSISWATMFTNY
jgi:hypothetical protein